VSLVAYAEIRPVHVADLLSREGHPLAARVVAARQARSRDDAEARPKEFNAGAAARRTLGIAAGTMLVAGAVAAGMLGLNHGSTPTSTAAGEPVGAAPSKGAPAKSHETPAAQAVAPYTNTAAQQSLSQTPSGPAGQIGTPARVAPPVAKAPAQQPQAPRVQQPAAPAAQPAAVPAPSAPAPGPVQSLAAPVAQGVGGTTLDNVVAPVTQTVDNTLQPALSLIGGLLGH
jgi:hypothetical protein